MREELDARCHRSGVPRKSYPHPTHNPARLRPRRPHHPTTAPTGHAANTNASTHHGTATTNVRSLIPYTGPPGVTRSG